jgi:hypothetical protein
LTDWYPFMACRVLLDRRVVWRSSSGMTRPPSIPPELWDQIPVALRAGDRGRRRPGHVDKRRAWRRELLAEEIHAALPTGRKRVG